MTDKSVNSNPDIEVFIKSANDLSNQAIKDMGELEAIFKAIKSVTNEHTDIHKLASAGAHLAMDKANANDCWREQIMTEIKEELSA